MFLHLTKWTYMRMYQDRNRQDSGWVGLWNRQFVVQYEWATSWENLFMPYANNKAQISLHIRAVWSAPLLFAA